jgi:hypothetical protein
MKPEDEQRFARDALEQLDPSAEGKFALMAVDRYCNFGGDGVCGMPMEVAVLYSLPPSFAIVTYCERHAAIMWRAIDEHRARHRKMTAEEIDRLHAEWTSPYGEHEPE